MSLSSIIKQTEGVLQEVLRDLHEDQENRYPMLCETDRNLFVKEEESLWERLKDTRESDINGGWRRFLCLPSSQAVKCLKDAHELSRRVKDDINAKLRTRLTRSSAGTPEIDARLPLVESGFEATNAMITSPLNMRCSISEPVATGENVNPTALNDYDDASDMHAAITSPLDTTGVSSDASRDSSSRRHRRSPPPPPLPRTNPSRNSHLLSEASSNVTNGSFRRSPSVRRPAPPPPRSPTQSTTSRSSNSPIRASFSSNGSSPPSPAMISSMSSLAQNMSMLASSIATESMSGQTPGRQRARVIKTNCVDVNDSRIDGLTVNNGGSNNSGAVIHRMMAPPPRPSRQVPTF